MAGGLFGRPFVFNEKCIIFSLILHPDPLDK